MKKTHLSESEQAKAEILAAEGVPPTKIGKLLGRHRITVQHHLAKPDVAARVEIDKRKFAELFLSTAERLVKSVTQDDIEKSSLLQRMTAAGIAVDKAAVLTGEGLPTVNVTALLAAVQSIWDMRRTEDMRRTAQPGQPQLPAGTE
ncbi:MAG: helix-turn-helix domain-containing protein [Terracidiphilus sp.]